MFPAPDPTKCCAYQGSATGAWYVIVMSRQHDRYIFAGRDNAMTALMNAARAARYKGWID